MLQTRTANSRLADIHTHILPGMDDGAKTAEESIRLLVKLSRQGVTDVVFTPHFDISKESVEAFCQRRQESFELLCHELKLIGYGENLSLHLGAEVMYDPNLVYADIEKLRIGNTSYLLMELTGSHPFNLDNTLNYVFSKGMIPVLAHIERYNYLCTDAEFIERLIDDGVVMQCNASALFSRRYSKALKKLIKRGYVHLLASDTHSVEKRPPMLGDALKKLKKHSEYLITNSAKVIEDKPV